MSTANAVHRQEAICFHEAAHCALSNFYGHKIASVEIGEDSGHCQLANQRIKARDYLICLCAGRAANRISGWEGESDKPWHGSADYNEALKVARAISDGDDEAARLLVRYSERRAELLLEKHWSLVTRLAFTLLERDRLSGEEISKVLTVS